MTTIYKGLTSRGFMAFWQSDPAAINFFMPCEENKFFKHTSGIWSEHKALYKEDAQLSRYDEVVNAAWHILGRFRFFIDRDKFAESTMEPGFFYPRIWRGAYFSDNPFYNTNSVDLKQLSRKAYTQSVVATSNLFEYLIKIFENIEPEIENYSAFGHRLRELLILTCTEIESAWRAILIANRGDFSSFTTRDFVKLKQPLRLDEWAVRLKDYSDSNFFRPFANWSDVNPTKSLPWYDAYNAVKHNRERHLSDSTLSNLLSAMAALHIMQTAQWGPDIYSILHDNRFSPFELTSYPDYEACDWYMPGLSAPHDLKPKMFFGNDD